MNHFIDLESIHDGEAQKLTMPNYRPFAILDTLSITCAISFHSFDRNNLYLAQTIASTFQ